MNIMRIIRKICALICSMALFCVLLLTMLLITTKNLITKDNLASYIQSADILDMKANTLIDIGPEGNQITLKEKIQTVALDSNIPEDIVNDLLESRQLNELLGEFFSETIDYVLNGGEKPTLSDDTINKMKIAALQSSANHINVTLENEELEQYVEIYTNRLRELLPERSHYIGTGVWVNNIRDFLGLNTIYLYLSMFVLAIFIGIFCWSTYKPLQYVSITMIVAGAIFVIIGSTDGVLNPLLVSKMISMKAIISPLITNILTLWFKCGVIVSFGGMFLLVIYAIIARVMRHNAEYKKVD